MGAGLGGGSSDAAATLWGLNELWGLQLSRKELMNLGVKLGADVPFFLFGQNAFVEGIGELLQAVMPSRVLFFIGLSKSAHSNCGRLQRPKFDEKSPNRYNLRLY